MKIAKEQITDLKKKLVEAEGVKNVAEWARDEALRAKKEAEFARAEAEGSKDTKRKTNGGSGGDFVKSFIISIF